MFCIGHGYDIGERIIFLLKQLQWGRHRPDSRQRKIALPRCVNGLLHP